MMTPNREQLEQELLAYVEGTLSPADHARLEIFLANTDPKLARQIAGMMDDRLALQSLPAVSAPSDLADRIMDQVERQSLIGGVEKQLVHEPRRWFLNRMAIAAGLFIVVGGFSFYVIHMAFHRDTPLHDLVLNGTPTAGERKVASAEPAAAPRTQDDLPLNRSASADAGAAGGRGAATGPVLAAVPAAPAAIVDRDAQVKTLVEKGRMMAMGSAAASGDYKYAASTKEALAMLESPARRDPLDAPVVITVVARDSQDIRRLETLLASFSTPAADAPANPQTSPKDVTSGKPGGAAADGIDDGRTPPRTLAKSEHSNIRAITGTAPDTYHLLLKPEQLDQLTQDFSVASVARGNSAYSIAGAAQAALPSQAGQLAMDQKDNGKGAETGLNQAASQAKGAVPQNQTQNTLNSNGYQNGGTPLSNAGNNSNNSDNNRMSENDAEKKVATNTPATFPAANPSGLIAPSLGEKVAGDRESGDSGWIDCVITIVPQAATPALNPAATMPANR